MPPVEFMEFDQRDSKSSGSWIKVRSRLQRTITPKRDDGLNRSFTFSLIVIPKEARAWGELSRYCCG
jgi:hypothetical protein